MGQFHWDPAGYLAMMRAEVPAYEDLQAALVRATAGAPARRILELGTGTGETARRVLDAHPEAERLLALDASGEMLAAADVALRDRHLPSRVGDQLGWLRGAGLAKARVTWSRGDLAVLAADRDGA